MARWMVYIPPDRDRFTGGGSAHSHYSRQRGVQGGCQLQIHYFNLEGQYLVTKCYHNNSPWTLPAHSRAMFHPFYGTLLCIASNDYELALQIMTIDDRSMSTHIPYQWLPYLAGSIPTPRYHASCLYVQNTT
jgi:hypothetical protein